MYIKVKNEYKRLNNAKKRTNYLVCNIEGTGTEVNPESWTQLKGSNETNF